MSEEEIARLFEECSVEGNPVLDERETEYFWLRTGLIGWSAADEVRRSTAYRAYLEVKEKHRTLADLIEKTDRKMLLHTLQADIKECELEEIVRHIRNK
ncbi:uncharacterized protein NEMAJ01_1435 [Nematocida major]|uniref:uncharacterized protein n=1 Tax=Nematocida major TaxID=1912982 RepID=UPI0020076999|nr:uncharacterized protein NEMAJ01_1435 [Nematocida major]KAH9386539.1 hypothetical protein NEMAJ01_1435 [Nematocida major]